MSKEIRIEVDSIGEIEVPAKCYWGAQTQRSIENFKITNQHMPLMVIMSMVKIKYCAAQINSENGLLDNKLANAIMEAAKRVINGEFNDQFPLVVWQTGSGTQTNMNVNEVLAAIANEILTGERKVKSLVHPNDHVNMGQSSNDTFPTAMHIATIFAVNQNLLPALNSLYEELKFKSEKWSNITKIGRTHMQDAVPMTVGQEFSAFATQIKHNIERLNYSLQPIYSIAQGGTAIGTGINSPKWFSEKFAVALSKFTGYQFKPADNKFEALSSHDPLVELSGSFNTIAVSLMKLANDIRLLSSGPRCGLAEIKLPENEPGSSIMPGKINPTQCEALSMACAQVMGNHFAITIGGSNGHLQLNVFKPLIIQNILYSIELISDSVNNFVNKCLKGIEPDEERINFLLNQSLMLVTALSPKIGYDKAAFIARTAYDEKKTLKEIAIKHNLISEKEFDECISIKNML